MKRLFMLFAIAVVAFACGESVENPSNGVKSEIVVMAEEPMWLDSEVGFYEIEYSIKNPVENVKLDAYTSVDWASIIEIKADAVSFIV